MRSFFLLALFVVLCNAQNLFVWNASISTSDPESYVEKQLPCQKDNIVIESNRSTIVYISGDLKVHSIVLPDDGEVLFGPNVELGKKADWQCENEETQTKRIVEHPPSDFYDPKNWLIYDKEHGGKLLTRPRLDAMRVPGDQDRALFPLNGSSRILMNYPAVIRELRFGNMSVNSDQMYSFLLTLEGRRRIALGGQLATTVEINHKKYMWPYSQVFSVRDLPKPTYGRHLSNVLQPQFTGLCLNLECVNAADYCDNPLILIGHCCPICTTVATFRASNLLNFWLVQKGLQELESMYPSYLGISKIRLDSNAAHPIYQLAIIPDHPKNYDEKEFGEVLSMALYAASNWYIPSDAQMFDIKIYTSLQKSFIHFGRFFKYFFLVLASFVLVGGIFALEYRRNARLRLWLADRWASSNGQFRVAFKRGTDLVQLWRGREESQQLPPLSFNVEFENLVFQHEEPATSKKSKTSQLDQESTNNESDYLSLSESETLGS